MQTVLLLIANVLHIDYDLSQIQNAHWLKRNSNETRPFNSVFICNKWLEAKKTKRAITAQNLNPSFPATQIYINECSTKKQRSLLEKCKNSAELNYYKFAWMRRDILYLRKSEVSPII